MSSPSGFPQFRSVSVFRPAPGTAAIKWVLHPHGWDTGDLAFGVYRSNNPLGPWDFVGEPDEGSMVFTDYNVQSMNTSRNYYYVVRALSKTGKGYRDSTPSNAGHDPDNIALELVRKKMLSLTVKNGIAGAVLLKRSWGPKCSRCYSKERGLAADPDCHECFGTSFVGGYIEPPVYVPTLFNPPKQAVVDAGLKYEAWSVFIELANYPFLSVDDLWVDRQSNIRYKVENIGLTTRRGFIISQIAQLNRVDENDAVYTIPITLPEHSMAERSWDLIDRTEPTSAQAALEQARPRPYSDP